MTTQPTRKIGIKMAIDKGMEDWGWYPAHDQERQDYAASLGEKTADELVNAAMDSYPKVGNIDIIIEELSRRALESEDPDVSLKLNERIEYLRHIRSRIAEILSAGGPLSRQNILPEELTVRDEVGQEHAFRFSAFELANTGELTSEGRARAALKANGIIAGVTRRTFREGTGISEWIEVSGSRWRGTQKLGVSAHSLATEADPAQAL